LFIGTTRAASRRAQQEHPRQQQHDQHGRRDPEQYQAAPDGSDCVIAGAVVHRRLRAQGPEACRPDGDGGKGVRAHCGSRRVIDDAGDRRRAERSRHPHRAGRLPAHALT